MRSVPATPIDGREYRHTAFAHAGKQRDGFLELLRLDVVAAADDDVLGTAGHIELAIREVTEVAGIEPFTVEQLLGSARIVEVAAGRRWTQKLDAPLGSFGQDHTAFVHDANRMAGQHRAAGDDAQRRRAGIDRDAGYAAAQEAFAVDSFDQRSATDGRKGLVRARSPPARRLASGAAPQAVGAKRAMNRSTVCGLTSSAPFSAIRSERRLDPQARSLSILFRHSS